jgi:hypothetical protein
MRRRDLQIRISSMGHAAALFTAIGVGALAAVASMVAVAWRIRNGPRPRSLSYALTHMGLLLVPPVVLAFAMPDFKTALIAWFGFCIGLAVSKVLTLPLGYFLVRRIERRQAAR